MVTKEYLDDCKQVIENRMQALKEAKERLSWHQDTLNARQQIIEEYRARSHDVEDAIQECKMLIEDNEDDDYWNGRDVIEVEEKILCWKEKASKYQKFIENLFDECIEIDNTIATIQERIEFLETDIDAKQENLNSKTDLYSDLKAMMPHI